MDRSSFRYFYQYLAIYTHLLILWRILQKIVWNFGIIFQKKNRMMTNDVQKQRFRRKSWIINCHHVFHQRIISLITFWSSSKIRMGLSKGRVKLKVTLRVYLWLRKIMHNSLEWHLFLNIITLSKQLQIKIKFCNHKTYSLRT